MNDEIGELDVVIEEGRSKYRKELKKVERLWEDVRTKETEYEDRKKDILDEKHTVVQQVESIQAREETIAEAIRNMEGERGKLERRRRESRKFDFDKFLIFFCSTFQDSSQAVEAVGKTYLRIYQGAKTSQQTRRNIEETFEAFEARFQRLPV